LNATDDLYIGPLARRDGEPAFNEPWQAQVLALAFALSKVGVFTPVQWSDVLGRELRHAARRGDPDNQTTYYAAALAALEGLIAADGRVTPDGLSSRIEQWRCAYLKTPHGKPVELSAGSNT
jgi:nitrile hydratase accessory protein